MDMKKRKNVKILPADWKKLKKLAFKREMTMQAQFDAMIKAYLLCVKYPEIGKENEGEK